MNKKEFDKLVNLLYCNGATDVYYKSCIEVRFTEYENKLFIYSHKIF